MIPKSSRRVYLPPVRANIGVEAAYARRLDALIDEMNRSLIFWISAAYRANEPEIFALASDAYLREDFFTPSGLDDGQSRPVNDRIQEIPVCVIVNDVSADVREFHKHQIADRRRDNLGTPSHGRYSHGGVSAFDASPARELIAVVRRLAARWQRRFDQLAPELSSWFATASAKRSDEALRASLRKGGFTVKFKPTRAQNDAYQAVIGENVGLIKSIPAQHLTQVEGMVMRSVQVGRDLGPLVRDLEHQFRVTRRRASFIARDQNNKATAVLTRVRHQELGIAEARWQHSHGGKAPRPTHLKASKDRTVYRVAEGWYDPAVQKHVWPGELPNCRCVAIPVIPGFS